MPSFPRGRALAIATALAVVYVVWGSTYIGIAITLESLPPLLSAAARFLVAGAILYPIASRFGDRAADRPGRRQWLAALITGAPLLALGNGGVVWAQQTVPVGIAALVIATVPLWIALLDRLLFGNRLSGLALGGLAIGFGGVALLVAPGSGGNVDTVGALVLVLAAFSWASGSLLARGAALPTRPLVAASMQMLAGGGVLVVAGVASGELTEVRLDAFSGRALLALGYLVVFGSIVAFTSYGWLLRNARTSLVATYAYVNPVVALILAALVLGEGVTARMLVAGAIILAAVALVVSARSEPGPGSEPREATQRAPARRLDRWRAAAATRGR